MQFSIRRSLTAAGAVLAILLAMLVAQVAGAHPARADYGAMIQPVSGHVEYVVAGTSPVCGRSNHTGIDINGNGGQSIVAAYGGTVTGAGPGGNYGNVVTINHGNGYTTLYAHLRNNSISVNVGDQVVQGQHLGLVGTTGNSFGEHLHFEIKRNGSNISNQGYSCGQNVTRGASIPMDTPGLEVAAPAAPSLMFSLNTAGQMEGKHGLAGSVDIVASNAVRGDSDGEAVAIVDSSGTAWGKIGYTSPWVTLAYHAVDIKVDGQRFIFLDTNGDVYAKDGLYASEWTYLTYAVTAIDADNNRVGVVGTDKRLYVKEGLHGDWVPLADNVTNFSLGGDRIGVIANGSGSAKEGSIYAPWVAMTNGTQIDVTTDRVAVRDGTVLHVKVGDLQQPWAWNVAQNLRDLDIEGDRVLVTDTVGDVYFKQGAITASWVKVFVNGLTADLN